MQKQLESFIERTGSISGCIIQSKLLNEDRYEMIKVMEVLNTVRDKMSNYAEIMIVRGTQCRSLELEDINNENDMDTYIKCKRIHDKIVKLQIRVNTRRAQVRVVIAFLDNKEDLLIFALIELSANILLATYGRHLCFECESLCHTNCGKCGIYLCNKDCRKKSWPIHKKICCEEEKHINKFGVGNPQFIGFNTDSKMKFIASISEDN